jgi:hypothetical protein
VSKRPPGPVSSSGVRAVAQARRRPLPPLWLRPRMLPCSTWRPISSLRRAQSSPPPGLSGAVRTHPFAPNTRKRPGKSPVGTALSPRYLIRMRALVQVLQAHQLFLQLTATSANHRRCPFRSDRPVRASRVPLPAAAGSCERVDAAWISSSKAAAMAASRPAMTC